MAMTNKALAEACKNIATNYNTVYALGMFGAPITKSTIKSKANQYPGWYTATKVAALEKLVGKGYFGFDCCCMIKAILWGWKGDATQTYGGAVYKSNNVPDIGTEEMIAVCSGVSTDFSSLTVGELLWMKGHVGVYIGNGLAVECTAAWQGKVQITACNRDISGYKRRNWTKHGKLPYITYESTAEAETTTVSLPVLQKGAKVKTVRTLQVMLNYRGGYGLEVDGSFGPATDAAVRRYQTANSLEADGICGPKTWATLLQ